MTYFKQCLLSNLLLLVCVSPGYADLINGPNPYASGFGFDRPNQAGWGGWSRGDFGTLYAEWDSFIDTSYPGALTAAADVGQSGVNDANIGWNAGTFTAGSGNLYSFSVEEKFKVTLSATPTTDPVRAVLQLETWGVQMNYDSILLNGLRPTFSNQTFFKNNYESSFGSVELVQYLVYWDLDQAVANYVFNFNGGTSLSLAQVAIDIGSVNQKPTANAGPDQTVPNEARVNLDGSGSFDADNDSLIYTWTQQSGPVVQLSANDVAQPSFHAPQVTESTTLTFSLTVTDGKGAVSAADAVLVNVTKNRAPKANAGADRSVVEASGIISLQGTAEDMDGTITSYQWLQTAGPTVDLLAVDTASAQFMAPTIDTDSNLQFRLVVVDNEGMSSNADTVSITVCNREASGCKPTADAGLDRSALIGEIVTLDSSASLDPQNQPLTAQWMQVAGPKVNISDVLDAQAVFTVPVVKSNTVLSFQLIVQDTDGNISETDTVNVTINVVNTAPVADAPSLVSIRAGATLVLDGGASYDPENDLLNYHWEQTAGTRLTLSSQTAEKPSAVVPLSALGQTLRFLLTVDDGQLQSQQKIVNVDIQANSAPSLTLDKRLVTMQNSEVVLHASAQDPDADSLRFLWEQISGSEVELVGADSAELRFTAPEAIGNTQFLRFRLTVSDDFTAQTLSVSAEIEVVVTSDGSELDCSAAKPSLTSLWPANKGFKPVKINGIQGPNDYKLTITGIYQDEPVRNKALKDTTRPDAKIVKPKATRKKPRVKQSVLLRAERQGIQSKRQPFSGNGRIYSIRFQANDGYQTCNGQTQVEVPPVRNSNAIEDAGGEYDSTK